MGAVFLTGTRRKKAKAMFRGYWRVGNSPRLFKAVQLVIYMQMREPNCGPFTRVSVPQTHARGMVCH